MTKKLKIRRKRNRVNKRIKFARTRTHRNKRIKVRRQPKGNAIPRNKRQAELRELSLAVAALSWREKLPLSIAAKIEGIKPSTALRYAGSAFKKKGKDYVAKPSARIERPLTIIDSKGTRPIIVNSSRAASTIGKYWNAVKKFQRTGDDSALKQFHGKTVPHGGFKFITNPAALKKFADAGVLDFENIYWRGKVL